MLQGFVPHLKQRQIRPTGLVNRTPRSIPITTTIPKMSTSTTTSEQIQTNQDQDQPSSMNPSSPPVFEDICIENIWSVFCNLNFDEATSDRDILEYVTLFEQDHFVRLYSILQEMKQTIKPSVSITTQTQETHETKQEDRNVSNTTNTSDKSSVPTTQEVHQDEQEEKTSSSLESSWMHPYEVWRLVKKVPYSE